jgi:hypothetical protein
MQSAGSTIGAIPNEYDNMANAIRMIEAHTPKAMSAEYSRSCVAMGGYKTVDENKAMSLSTPFLRTSDLVTGKGSESRLNSKQ